LHRHVLKATVRETRKRGHKSKACKSVNPLTYAGMNMSPHGKQCLTLLLLTDVNLNLEANTTTHRHTAGRGHRRLPSPLQIPPLPDTYTRFHSRSPCLFRSRSLFLSPYFFVSQFCSFPFSLSVPTIHHLLRLQTLQHTAAQPHRQTDRQTHRRTVAQTDRQTDAQSHSRTDRQTHRRAEACTYTIAFTSTFTVTVTETETETTTEKLDRRTISKSVS